MEEIASITSKGQFTIPVAIFRRAGFKPKQKILVKLVDAKKGILSLTSMSTIVEELAGSVKVADEYKGLDLDKAIEKAKKNYFAQSP